MATSILDFYDNILASVGMQANEEGLISRISPSGGLKPVIVDEKRLVMPTEDRLRDGFGKELQPFHPLSENLARRGVSPVMSSLQRTAKSMATLYFSKLAGAMMEVAADPDLQAALPPECREYLRKVPGADKKTVNALARLLQAAITKNQLVTLYLRNGGSLSGKKYDRLCIVRFPIIEAVDDEEEPKPLGVNMPSKKARKVISALLHYIMPFGDSPEEYSAGSNSKVAPFLEAFLLAYANIGKRFNHLIQQYGKPMDLPLAELVLDYTAQLDDMGEFYRKIPPLAGNDGTLSKQAEAEQQEAKARTGSSTRPEPAAAPKAPATPTAPSGQHTAQPVASPQAPTEQPAQSGGGVSLKDFMQSIRPQQPQQPQQAQYPQHQMPPPYGNPPGQPPGHGPQHHYMGAQQPRDPRFPDWLPGAPPAPPQNPFASAVLGGSQQPQAQAAPRPNQPQGGPPWNTGGGGTGVL